MDQGFLPASLCYISRTWQTGSSQCTLLRRRKSSIPILPTALPFSKERQLRMWGIKHSLLCLPLSSQQCTLLSVATSDTPTPRLNCLFFLPLLRLSTMAFYQQKKTNPFSCLTRKFQCLPASAKEFSSDPDRPNHQAELARQTTFEHKPSPTLA